MTEVRLDRFLVEKGLVESRNKAAQLIKSGKVLVAGEVLTKPSKIVDPAVSLEITEPLRFVGRAGLKLEKALEEFNLSPKGMTVLDVGSSTGGFTDCLLQHGAKKVFAVDVGHKQLHESLRRDKRVVSLEGTDIRSLKLLPGSKLVDLITVDVSFISLTKVIPEFGRFLEEGGKVIILIKPQFEVGPEFSKGGVVKDKHHKKAIGKVKEVATRLGFQWKGQIESPIEGAAGNKEFLALLVKKGGGE
jgi:23S rRNA (cytidine1920-2'-O)/16S rRNA (cytidine1409-2'-O)-methyltransferase